ncbi:MAG: C1 family peptidase [Lachnospiraceae bacterium]|nr:C1 family peptidase [Lachnospiraceae bacterium]
MTGFKGISDRQLKGMSKAFNDDERAVVASMAAVKNGVMEAATDYREARKYPFTFSVDLKQGDITNQKQSGRCWIFSALNTFRFELIKKYKLKTFELSQCYIFFYDKLEKANYFLESVIKTADEDIHGRLYSFINSDPLADGGQWDMLSNLVEKYGVCPKYAYPDAASATASRWFDHYLTAKLREDAMVLREMINVKKASKAEVEKCKEAQISEIYRMLCIALGEPPKSFDLVLKDKDGKIAAQEYDITPKAFFDKYIGIKLEDQVSIIHAPTKDKPFNRTYTVKFLGNVAEGKPVSYLNLEMDKIKKAVIKQLKDGHPVWFGSDCTKYGLRKEGIFDKDSAAVEKLFGVSFGFSKAQSLDYGDSAMNHAMVILGVNLDEKGNPNRWRIENSWGKDAGSDGYYVASDEWFDDFVYQVVVNKKYLDAETKKLTGMKPKELEPWDPFGTLAD